MSLLFDLIAALLLVAGGTFGLLGSWGLVRFPSTMTRLHTPTMTATLGLWGVLGAALILFAAAGEGAGHEVVVALFLLMTAPLSALFIAKTVIWRAQRQNGAAGAAGQGWSGLAPAGGVAGGGAEPGRPESDHHLSPAKHDSAGNHPD